MSSNSVFWVFLKVNVESVFLDCLGTRNDATVTSCSLRDWTTKSNTIFVSLRHCCTAMSRTGMHTFLRQERKMCPPFFHFLALTFGSIGSITSSYASSVTMDSTSLKSEAANLAFDACSLTFRASSFPSRFVRCQQVLFYRCENKSFQKFNQIVLCWFSAKGFLCRSAGWLDGADHFVFLPSYRSCTKRDGAAKQK
jgi:hypothetical protein